MVRVRTFRNPLLLNAAVSVAVVIARLQEIQSHVNDGAVAHGQASAMYGKLRGSPGPATA